MNEPVKFKRLRAIAAELNAKLDQLHLGELSTHELEALTEQSRELYERLVVLRFKAYHQDVTGTSLEVKEEQTIAPTAVVADVIEKTVVEEPAPAINTMKEPEIEAPVEPSISFRVSPNQITLIDAIEEVTKQENAQEEIHEEASIEAPEVPTSTIEQTLFTAPASAPETAVQEQVATAGESLYERLSKTVGQQESLAKKMENTPIVDLKKAISLNQRFQFSKELFKGNNQDYEVAIDRLNTVEREEALKHLQQLKSKYAWSDESSVTQDFVDLVSRRHA
jgi:ribosomal protein L29